VGKYKETVPERALDASAFTASVVDQLTDTNIASGVKALNKSSQSKTDAQGGVFY
jgi:hypothetical protein